VVVLAAVAGMGLCAVAVAGFIDSYAHPTHVSLGYIPPQPAADAATGGGAAAAAVPAGQPATAAPAPGTQVPAPPPAAVESAPVAAAPAPAQKAIKVVKRVPPVPDHESKQQNDHGGGD